MWSIYLLYVDMQRDLRCCPAPPAPTGRLICVSIPGKGTGGFLQGVPVGPCASKVFRAASLSTTSGNKSHYGHRTYIWRDLLPREGRAR